VGICDLHACMPTQPRTSERHLRRPEVGLWRAVEAVEVREVSEKQSWCCSIPVLRGEGKKGCVTVSLSYLERPHKTPLAMV
jgi:hypothetical protein